MKTAKKRRNPSSALKDLPTTKNSVRGGSTLPPPVMLSQSAYSQATQTVSNLMKSVSDTQSTIVSNLKG
jgi:hypothetical protein